MSDLSGYEPAYYQRVAARRGRHRAAVAPAGGLAAAIRRDGDALHAAERAREAAERRLPDTRTCPWIAFGQDPTSGLWAVRCVCGWVSPPCGEDGLVGWAAAHRQDVQEATADA